MLRLTVKSPCAVGYVPGEILKAGISFLAVYDGSCFNPLQAVVNDSLPNYQDEVLRLTTGCSIEVTGTVVPSPGEGQSFELQATAIKVVGWVDDPDTYPMAAKRHSIEYLREVATCAHAPT
ncbi:Asparagine--tRNA ligase [Serratia fonticola]|uniref:Asparagine--tRNA ligase n=1 Tax=Serratia fonticola TaxID=47917 RepID=A0A4U9UXR1_SERFO|nr:Asparagine--tRNA ligase [Serratia fonticola]